MSVYDSKKELVGKKFKTVTQGGMEEDEVSNNSLIDFIELIIFRFTHCSKLT